MSRRPALALLVAALLAAPSIGRAQTLPTPESVLGFQPGADYHLADYEQSIAYFRALDAASDRLQLIEVGRTSEDRPFMVAIISAPENLARLEHYKEISRRLAHPEGLTDAEARRLAREGKAIVHIDGAVHASEIAASQHTIQLAYDLIAGAEDPENARILENVIFMCWPTANPDGQTIEADWYMEHVGTPFEGSGPPRLYQKYVGHDNNRDAYMLNMIESRVIEKAWREWEPQIRYVQHQTAPFPARIWLPPFKDPVGEYVHPLMAREVNAIGMMMALRLEQNGQVGAIQGNAFDAWYPGYIDYMPMLQNSVAFWTETALYSYATPHEYSLQDVTRRGGDLRPQSMYASPWPGGWWRLRDAVEYMETASMATLDFAAIYKEDLLYGRYQAGRDIIAAYRENPPYAYVIPQDQRDPVAPVELLRRLAFNGIRVEQLSRPAQIGGTSYPAGTWVIPMDQAYAQLARTLLEVQHYPDIRGANGAPEPPYDVAGWTLPYLFDVDVVTVSEPLSEEARTAVVPLDGTPGDGAPFDSAPGVGFDTDPVAAAIVPIEGRMTGSGRALIVDPAQNNAFRAVNRTWKEGGSVRYADGKYVLSGLSDRVSGAMVRDLHLQATRGPARGDEVPRPRIGLFRPWQPSMDEGWTRWLLEMYDFDFTSVRPADFEGGPLAEKYDVLLFADYRASTILNGYREGRMPAEYVGGIGEEGQAALKAFVEGGGTVVCWNGSCSFAIDTFGLPVTDVTRGLSRSDFFISGSVLAIQPTSGHPVTAGMDAQGQVFFSSSPVFEPAEGFTGTVLATYPSDTSPLLSGYALGAEHMQGKAAALDVPFGKGHVVLFGFGPQWRGQPFGSFRLLFNAAIYHR